MYSLVACAGSVQISYNHSLLLFAINIHWDISGWFSFMSSFCLLVDCCSLWSSWY